EPIAHAVTADDNLNFRSPVPLARGQALHTGAHHSQPGASVVNHNDTDSARRRHPLDKLKFDMTGQLKTQQTIAGTIRYPYLARGGRCDLADRLTGGGKLNECGRAGREHI